VEEVIASELADIFQKPLEEGLFLLSRHILAQFKKDRAFCRMLLFSALENHPLSRLMFRQRLPFPEALKSFLLEKSRGGENRFPDPEIAAKAFFGMLFHYVMITQIFRAKDYFPKKEDDLLRSYVRLFTQGVAS
jgi:AcrR family transcriptional regulator